MGRQRVTFRAEEEHAKILLEAELGIEFRHHDDGSKPRMPDLISLDGSHIAEVITTAPAAVREAEQSLHPMPNVALPHCVWVIVPYRIVGGAILAVRRKIEADVLKWTAQPRCQYHWPPHNEARVHAGDTSVPVVGLRVYDDGVKVLCVQHCKHSNAEPHQIDWTVVHERSLDDPWKLIRRSLHIVDESQHGGVDALAKKLDGYPNKHLVMYPFGPPGNLTAAFSQYVPPSNLNDLLPPELNPPLADIHVWLPYRYGNGDVVEGLHVSSGQWERFAARFPRADDPLG